jgi:hypothetical protein
MTQTLLAVVAGAALSVSAAVPAPDSHSHSPGQSDLRPAASVHEPSLDLDRHSLPDRVLARTVGTGPTSDFLCGAAAGAGFALTLSGVGAIPGVLLGGAGMACAMFF